MHARRACRTAVGTIATGAFLFVLRNCFGTSSLPNSLCRAKTLWSCNFREREPRILMSGVVLCVWDGKRCIDV
jgi:hypothetical protein